MSFDSSRQRDYFEPYLRVRFFKKIQDWILNPRSCRFVIFKDTKNPKMDFFSN